LNQPKQYYLTSSSYSLTGYDSIGAERVSFGMLNYIIHNKIKSTLSQSGSVIVWEVFMSSATCSKRFCFITIVRW